MADDTDEMRKAIITTEGAVTGLVALLGPSKPSSLQELSLQVLQSLADAEDPALVQRLAAAPDLLPRATALLGSGSEATVKEGGC